MASTERLHRRLGGHREPSATRSSPRRCHPRRQHRLVGPFVVTSLAAYFLLDWSTRASLIAGTALSTTSLAVVYAVLVERGLTHTGAGKLLMGATFVNGPLHGAGTLGDLPQAERLVSGVPRHLRGADLHPPASGALVLRPPRRPRGRARDQARVRLFAGADGSRRCLERTRGAAGVRPGSRHEPALRRAP